MTLPPIRICGRDDAERALRALAGEAPQLHVVSIGGARDAAPPSLDGYAGRKIRLVFDDIEMPYDAWPHYAPVTWAQVAALIGFAQGVNGPVLSHCAAGISRSSAAAAVIGRVLAGPGSERRVLEHLRALKPDIWPNRRVLWMADVLLGGGGAFRVAHEAIWGEDRGVLEVGAG